MAITDELRKWFDRYTMRKDIYDELTDIADRIDAAHEEALGSKVAMAISVGEDGTEFVSMPAKELSERYVELPKDADGVPIKPGDKLYVSDLVDHDGEVSSLALRKKGWEIYWYGWRELEMDEYHHTPPSVEDVLREFVTEFNRDDSELCDGEIIERFAKRLRLADGAD